MGIQAGLAASASASGCHLLGRRQGYTGFRARRARQSGVQTDGGFTAAEPRRSIGSGVTGGHCVNDAFCVSRLRTFVLCPSVLLLFLYSQYETTRGPVAKHSWMITTKRFQGLMRGFQAVAQLDWIVLFYFRSVSLSLVPRVLDSVS